MYKKLNEVFKCVKCGKCLPVCPVYEFSPDEFSGARGKCLVLKAFFNKEIENLRHLNAILSKCCYCLRCQARCQVGIDFKTIFPLSRYLAIGGEIEWFEINSIPEENKEKIIFVKKEELNRFQNLFPELSKLIKKDFKVVFYEGFLRHLFFNLKPDIKGIFKKLEPFWGNKIFFLDSLDGFLLKNFFCELFFDNFYSSKLKGRIFFLEEAFSKEKILAPSFLEIELGANKNFFYQIPFELFPENFEKEIFKNFKNDLPDVITFYPPFFNFF